MIAPIPTIAKQIYTPEALYIQTTVVSLIIILWITQAAMKLWIHQGIRRTISNYWLHSQSKLSLSKLTIFKHYNKKYNKLLL